MRFSEVQYFTQLATHCEDDTYHYHNVAIIKPYSEPRLDVLNTSSQMVAACTLTGEISVIPISSIHSVIAMIPRTFDSLDGEIEERFCVLRQPGINVSDLGLAYDVFYDDDNDVGDTDE
jgi:hypothetical protein